MKLEVTFLEKRGSAVMRRAQQLEIIRQRAGLRFGRGTGNEVQLPDIRVDLTAAVLFPRTGRFSIQALGPSPLRVNGRSTRSEVVDVGDEIMIGPYRVELAEPPEGCDGALVIELVQPLGDALARLTTHNRMRLGSELLNKRRLGWVGFVVILLICLVAPIIIYNFRLPPFKRLAPSGPRPGATLASLWEPGEMSNSHRFFANACGACHSKVFARVPDKVCLECHQGDRAHFSAVNSATGERPNGASDCASCHEEHRGRKGIIISDSELCLGCHRDLIRKAEASDVPNVPDFARHPQFRVRLVADAAGPRFARAELGEKPSPQDHPGIKFSHAAHLVRGGFPPLGYKEMECADCHLRESGGQGFLPITYKGQCEHCHALKFEREDLPWSAGKVPHGSDVDLQAVVWNFYAGKALQGAIREADSPSVPRQAPGIDGATGAVMGGTSAMAWVSEQAEAALRTVVLDEKRGCGYCHFGAGPGGTFDLSGVVAGASNTPQRTIRAIVAPVLLQTRFLPAAHFDHSKHRAVACEDCHAARGAKASGVVLIPGIENCHACHGAQHATTRAESTCTTCHAFHRNVKHVEGTPAP